MHKFYSYILLLNLLIISSCKNERSNIKDYNIKQDTLENYVDVRNYNDEDELVEENKNTNYDDIDFPITEYQEMEFIENMEGYEEKGAVLKIKFKMKNNTENIITNFSLKYYIKAIFKDKDYNYFPSSLGSSLANNDEGRFNGPAYDYFEYNLTNDEVWKPNSEKEFEFLVFKEELYTHKYSINNEYFKRTPNEVYFIYKYFATSVDEEYTKIMKYDLKDNWKEYQEKINLR